MKEMKKLFAALLAAVMALSLAACGGSESTASGESQAAASGDSAGGELLCNPLATISRAEAITLLGRTQARGYAEDDLSAFTDADQVPQWAASYIRTLVAQGVVNGTNDQIRPGGLLTRGEVAKLLYGML